MAKLAKIAAKIWGNSLKKEKGGLFATLEELMEQRKNLPYIRQKNKFRNSTQAGEVRSAFKGRGIELEEIREYAFGDDVRDIDWRVTARKNATYTKVYNEEKDREIYVLLDLSGSMIFGTKKELKSVTASKVAAIIGWLAQSNKDRFGVLIFDGKNELYFKPQHNQAHLLSILKKISQTSKDILEKHGQESSLRRPLQRMMQSVKSHATVFVVSDFAIFEDDEKAALAALAKKSQVFCLHIFDILERKPPQPAQYMIEENNQSLVFDATAKPFRLEYERYFDEKKERLVSFCKKFNCRYLEVSNDSEVVDYMRTI